MKHEENNTHDRYQNIEEETKRVDEEGFLIVDWWDEVFIPISKIQNLATSDYKSECER